MSVQKTNELTIQKIKNIIVFNYSNAIFFWYRTVDRLHKLLVQ
jgi:hypothetical protein